MGDHENYPSPYDCGNDWLREYMIGQQHQAGNYYPNIPNGIGQMGCDTVTKKVKKDKIMITKKMLEDNKFYVGSNDGLRRNWGFKTVEEAVAKATEMVNVKDADESEVFIVQIIKVVKRPQAPVVVEDI